MVNLMTSKLSSFLISSAVETSRTLIYDKARKSAQMYYIGVRDLLLNLDEIQGYVLVGLYH